MEERNKRPRKIHTRKSSEETNAFQKREDGGFGSRERFKGNSRKNNDDLKENKESSKRPRKRIEKKNEEESFVTKHKLVKKSSDGYIPKKRVGLEEGKEKKKFVKKSDNKTNDDSKRRFERKSSDNSEFGRKKAEGRGGRKNDRSVLKKKFHKISENENQSPETKKFHSGNDKYSDRKSDRFEEHRTEKKFKRNQFEESGDESANVAKNKSPYSKKKQLEYKLANPDTKDAVRLNKFIANAGICSRREADEYIKAGVVKINDKIITELGTKVKPGDIVKFNDSILKSERKVYLLLNKPKDYITTTDDPHAKNTVMELIEGACRERIYPVGRLDRNTTGLLLFTNDGEIAKRLTHPRYGKKKIYHVFLDKNLSIQHMERLLEGFETEEGFIQADDVSFVDESDKKQVGVEIHTGQNHAIKHLFETLGYRVEKLDRVYFAGLTKKNLPRGEWRFLSEKEISMLRMGSYE